MIIVDQAGAGNEVKLVFELRREFLRVAKSLLMQFLIDSFD